MLFEFFPHALQGRKFHLPLVSETRPFPACSDCPACCDRLRNPEDSEDVIDLTIFILISGKLFLEALPPLHSPSPITALSFPFSILCGYLSFWAILKELAVNGVRLLTYPPHTSQIF
jgi:hypothetical protein